MRPVRRARYSWQERPVMGETGAEAPVSDYPCTTGRTAAVEELVSCTRVAPLELGVVATGAAVTANDAPPAQTPWMSATASGELMIALLTLASVLPFAKVRLNRRQLAGTRDSAEEGRVISVDPRRAFWRERKLVRQ